MDRRDGVLGGHKAAETPYWITPKEDNYSREFAKLEDERMWGKVWLIFCREQELKNPGDFVSVDFVRDSIMVVKQQDGSLRAFYNICQHRGRKLKAGGDGRGYMSGNTGSSIRCSYHAWRWDIDGALEYVVDEHDYDGHAGCSRKDMALRPVRFDTWGGWVWVNMDPDAKPLREYLGSVPQFLDPYEFETCKIAWHKTVIFPCNWKTVLEAFNEGYHVEGTHTQITKNGWQPTISRAYGDHGWFGYEAVTAEAGPDAADTVRVGSGAAPTREVQVDFRKIIYEAQVEALETLKCLCSEYSVEAARRLSAVLPADAPYPQVAAKNLELHQQLYKELGIEWPKGMTPQVIQEAGTDWHVFPNQIGLPAIDGIEWYRLRPNGDHPESCIFDVWWLQRYPEGKEPPIQHDFYPTPDDFRGENPFLEQDFANLIAVQQGMHSRGFDGQRTNPVQELAISNFHRALHRYLGLDQEK